MKPLDETPLDELKGWSDADRIARLEKHTATTLVERRRITRLQRSQLWAVYAFGALLIISAIFFGKHLDSNSHQISRSERSIEHAQGLATAALAKAEKRHTALRAYQIRACKRGNELRAENNRSHLDDYYFDTELAALLTVGLAQPEAANPQLTPEERASNRRRATTFTAHLASFGQDKEWRALIPNCEIAVDHPELYHAPPPVKFSKRLPPKSVLEIQTGRGLDE